MARNLTPEQYDENIIDPGAGNEQVVTNQRSLSFLEDQNKRLQSFAYIVSHNLRSYAGNLQSVVHLYDHAKPEDQAELFSHISSISHSLSATIEHLDEIVKIQVETNKKKRPVRFEELFNNMLILLNKNIVECNAEIEYDFTKCPEVDYIPAYMESIFQNLLTNSLKYHYPGRQPVIKCYSFKDAEHIYLVFEDNGIGIDMEKYGDEIFGMYKTFHQNIDAKGIGLYITRSQVESLGGTIHIDSTIDVGTKFTIKLI